MSELTFPEKSASTPQLPERRGRRGWAWLAWLVIAAAVLFMAFGRRMVAQNEHVGGADPRLERILFKLQGRYLVGGEDLLHQHGLFGSAAAFRRGDVAERLRFVVLAGEMAGPDEALKELEQLDKDMAQHGVKPSKTEAKTRQLLGRLYQDYCGGRLDGPSLAPADREYLQQQLDWFGELALAPAAPRIADADLAAAAGAPAGVAFAPPDPALRRAVLEPAHRTFGILFGGVGAMLFAGFFGFIGMIVLVILALLGHVYGGVRTGSGRGGIYAETFAVWLVLFLVLSYVAGRLALGLEPLLQVSVFMLLSLVALGWPVLRGVPWRCVREDIGLTAGRQPALEPAIGLACYAMSIPFLLAGIILTLLLLHLQQALSGGDGNPFTAPAFPTHPIVAPLVEGGLNTQLMVVLLASVVAPVVEETMFRGVLYRHLREASASFGPVLSFLVSGTIVSFIFAVIHPQGLVAVPVLMALAFGFVVAREWRGTLIPGMVGHAVNNAMVTLLLLFVLAD